MIVSTTHLSSLRITIALKRPNITWGAPSLPNIFSVYVPVIPFLAGPRFSISKIFSSLEDSLAWPKVTLQLSSAVSHGNALLVRALTASGRDAIGARITVTSGQRKQIDEVRSGGYFMSQVDFRVHFGLGSFSKADITIRWPQGTTETFKEVTANQWIVIREGKGILERHPLPLPTTATVLR